MILYHGSYMAVEKADYWRGREKLDFGRGFYTTPYIEQAIKWSERFLRRYGSRVVSSYEFDEAAARENLRILEFPAYNEDWLEYVTLCRMGVGNNENYDLIIGSVANDKVFEALEAYFNGYSNKTAAIKKLRFEGPNLQYCFANQNTIDTYLKFVGSDAIV